MVKLGMSEKIPKIILRKDRNGKYLVVSDDDAEEDSESTFTPNLPEYIAVEDNNETEGRSRQFARQGGVQPSEEFTRQINSAYNEIVYWRKNVFLVPSGKNGKEFIREIIFWVKHFNEQSKQSVVALKACMVLPALLLQKPSRASKAKDHSLKLEKRLTMWREGNILDLLKEGREIQKRLIASHSKRNDDQNAKIFARLILQGKVNAALRYLDENGNSGVLSLTQEVLQELREKHPKPAKVQPHTLLMGPIDEVSPALFDQIDEEMIFKAAMHTKGAGGPSNFDADQYRRILCSKNFHTVGKELREQIAIMARTLCTKNLDPRCLEAYVASRVIPLDKKPGVRPIGIGEVIRRIIGKAVSWLLKEEIKEAAGPLQTCAGHKGGSEAAIHAMKEIFSQEDTDGVILVDASNAFNRLNRKAAMHNLRITCPALSTYVINIYRHEARLFVTGGEELASMEGTTQGDNLAMAFYAISTANIITSTRFTCPGVKQVWLADDASGAGEISALNEWYREIKVLGEKYGYYVNEKKSWLILKNPSKLNNAKAIFGDSINITTEGKRHLGSVLGTQSFKEEYCSDLCSKWMNELQKLSEFAKSEPQAAYAAYCHGYKSKFTYFMRTIEGLENYMEPIEQLITNKFLPLLVDDVSVSDNERLIYSLPTKDGGLGINIIDEECKTQYKASSMFTLPLVRKIILQELCLGEIDEGIYKEEYREYKKAQIELKINTINSGIDHRMKRALEQAADKGSSNWLTALPLVDQGYNLTKGEFRDALRIRYDKELTGLPTHCPCGSRFDVNHALSCGRGGDVIMRHNEVRDLTASMLGELCNDIEIEPMLQPLTGEQMRHRTAVTGDEARLDVRARGFWRRNQVAFFDINVTHVNAASYSNSTTEQTLRKQENRKKRSYNQRVMDVEGGSFTPLVFGTNGSMGKECERFTTYLAYKLAEKRDEKYSKVVNWIRTRFSFSIMRAVLVCVRGTRSKRTAIGHYPDDFNLANFNSRLG